MVQNLKGPTQIDNVEYGSDQSKDRSVTERKRGRESHERSICDREEKGTGTEQFSNLTSSQ
uniref:Uncharacterized protein n=1 Tax=Setaria italica TaxID=4555 RepID=K3YXI7_SETIT